MTQDNPQEPKMTAQQKAEQIRLRLLCYLERAMDEEDPVVRSAILRHMEEYTQHLNYIMPSKASVGGYMVTETP